MENADKSLILPDTRRVNARPPSLARPPLTKLATLFRAFPLDMAPVYPCTATKALKFIRLRCLASMTSSP